MYIVACYIVWPCAIIGHMAVSAMVDGMGTGGRILFTQKGCTGGISISPRKIMLPQKHSKKGNKIDPIG